MLDIEYSSNSTVVNCSRMKKRSRFGRRMLYQKRLDLQSNSLSPSAIRPTSQSDLVTDTKEMSIEIKHKN